MWPQDSIPHFRNTLLSLEMWIVEEGLSMLRPLFCAFWGSYNYYPLHCVPQYKRKSLLNMDQWVDVNLFPPQAENTVKQNSPHSRLHKSRSQTSKFGPLFFYGSGLGILASFVRTGSLSSAQGLLFEVLWTECLCPLKNSFAEILKCPQRQNWRCSLWEVLG